MKKLNLTIVTVLISLFFSYQSIAQTATATVSYTGFMACDGCLLCGGDYWCINTNPSYCGATAGCLTKTFFDPVPKPLKIRVFQKKSSPSFYYRQN